MNPELFGIEDYLDAEGRVTRWPQKKKNRKDRMPILGYLASHFEDRDYTEKEVNEVLRSRLAFEDHVLIRRELVDQGFLGRVLDGSRYWKMSRSQE